ncbi:MAG: hypothetical protein NPIRA04_20080 [Nitrospirales bacterium]|nr:MAG: hypothetical protein NPIRA04_20080 [Nitrospirales bacterium]
METVCSNILFLADGSIITNLSETLLKKRQTNGEQQPARRFRDYVRKYGWT